MSHKLTRDCLFIKKNLLTLFQVLQPDSFTKITSTFSNKNIDSFLNVTVKKCFHFFQKKVKNKKRQIGWTQVEY